MRRLRDNEAPHTLPPNRWAHVKRRDPELQAIEYDRECIRQDMVSMANVSGHKPTMAETRKQLGSLSKGFASRAQKNLKESRSPSKEMKWFERRPSSILLGKLEIQGHKHVRITDFPPSRIAVIETLCPVNPFQSSAFTAAKTLVSFVAESEMRITQKKRNGDTTINANPAQRKRLHSVVLV